MSMPHRDKGVDVTEQVLFPPHLYLISIKTLAILKKAINLCLFYAQ